DEADVDANIRGAEEAPPEAAHEIEHGIEERDRAPGLRKHVDRIEGAAKENERRDQQHRYELQFLEVIGPDTDDEAEQAEGHGCQYQEEEHQDGMLDLQRHEEVGSGEDDQAENDGFGGSSASIAYDDFEEGDGSGQYLVDGA